MSNTQPSTPAQTTKLGRNWLMKTLLFLVLLFGFGIWGLYDALHEYPKRGEMDAARKLAVHLQAAQAANSLSADKLKVPDPKGQLAALRAKREELEAKARPGVGFEANAAKFELTRLDWLESLALMWRLNAEPRLVDKEAGPPRKQVYFDPKTGEGVVVAAGGGGRTALPPAVLMTRLVAKFNTTANVTPLSPFDMPVQWLFVGIGFLGGLYMLSVLLRAMSKRYSWVPETQALTIPGDRTIVPADLKELDKRLWHKFFVTLHLKDGRTEKLDLLRYVPLEEWVLSMERTAFPEESREPEKPAAADNPVAAVPNT